MPNVLDFIAQSQHLGGAFSVLLCFGSLLLSFAVVSFMFTLVGRHTRKDVPPSDPPDPPVCPRFRLVEEGYIGGTHSRYIVVLDAQTGQEYLGVETIGLVPMTGSR